MRSNRLAPLLFASALLYSMNALSSNYAYICERGDRGLFGVGGEERKCRAEKLNESFDRECRTQVELTFKTNGEYIDYSRDRNDHPLRSGAKEPYQAEVAIHGFLKNVKDARFLVFRRTDRNNKTKLSGCSLFTSQGKNWVDRHQLKFIKQTGHRYTFEVLQNLDHRAFLTIEDQGNYKVLQFVDDKGQLAGAPLLGVLAKNSYTSN